MELSSSQSHKVKSYKGNCRLLLKNHQESLLLLRVIELPSILANITFVGGCL